MASIRFSVRLFDTTALAADGSNIPRRSCEEYLQSADYQVIIRDKVAIGGSSHKDRRLRPELKGIVGQDDQVLIDDNALFYITRLYFKEGDNFLWADAETFDPDLFAGKRRENIINLQGLLKSGVRMPVSVVIQALWSKRGVAERIVRIKGFDFTQNPSFKGAGNVQVFSITNDATEAQVREFSATGMILDTKVYSQPADIFMDDNQIESIQLFSQLLDKYPNQSTFTYSQILQYYGQGSEQELKVRDRQFADIQRSELETAPVNPETDDKDYQLIKQYVHDDDRQALNILFRSNKDRLINIIKSVPNGDPNKDELIKARLNQFFRNTPVQTDKEFSLDPNTVADRVRTAGQHRYIQMQQIIKGYQKYWEQNPKLTPEKVHKLKLQFIQDISLLTKEVANEIYAGRTLNSLYALNQYGTVVRDAGIELSKTYRKLIIAERMLRFVPKGIYGEWLIDARAYYNALLTYAFGEGLPDLDFNFIKL